MTTKVKSERRLKADGYMALIDRFPLKPIRDDRQHVQAVKIIDELIGRRLDAGAGDYLDTLILLVNKYEDDRHTPAGLEMTPREALLAIMNANGLTQADVGRIVGSESAVSMFLKGRRALSKAHIKAIVERFGVNASWFL